MIVVDAVGRDQVTVTVNIQRMKRKIAFDKPGESESIHMCCCLQVLEFGGDCISRCADPDTGHYSYSGIFPLLA